MEQKYKLVSPLGLNARVASLIVGVFNRFASNTINVYYNGEMADGKSILSLITLFIFRQCSSKYLVFIISYLSVTNIYIKNLTKVQ